MRILTVFWSFFLCCSAAPLAWAQTPADSTVELSVDTLDIDPGTVRLSQPDTVYQDGQPLVVSNTPIEMMPPMEEEYVPRRASIYSAVLPGLGQFYNDQGWKAPIIYAAFGTVGYFVVWNHNRYVSYRNVLFSQIDSNPNNDLQLNRFTGLVYDPERDGPGAGRELSEDALRRGVDRFRRDRDLMVIVGIAVYVMQIVEAHIAAHLKEFSVMDDLTASIGPSVVPTLGSSSAGLSLRLNLN